MKKRYLILFALMAFSFQTFANMQTTGWRWRNDDGTLETATWMTADERVPVKITSNQIIRLRVRIDNPYDDADQNFTTTGLVFGEKELVHSWYENNPASPKYTGKEDFNLTGTSECFTALGPNEYFDLVSSSYVTDGAETNNLGITFNSLNTSDERVNWTPGKFMSTSQSVVVNHSTHTEIEYCIKPNANVVNGTYYFLGGGSDNIIQPGAEKLETFPELIVDIKTGISDIQVGEIKVSSGPGHIKVFDLPQGAIKISLYNMMGVLAKVVDEEAANGNVNIPTSDLAKGLYIVSVEGAGGKVQKKVIVN